MKALVLATKTRDVTVQEVPEPVPGEGQVLVRVRAVALNPVDVQYTVKPIAAQESRVVGTDFAGEVVQCGPGLAVDADPRRRPGARVAGFMQGACSVNDRPGAFAEYVAIDSDLVWLVPDALSFEEAAAVSMCGFTAAQSVYLRLGLPTPFTLTAGAGVSATSEPICLPTGATGNKAIKVLIYGASTSVGLYAAQLVRSSAASTGQPIRLFGVASRSKHQMLSASPYSYDVLVDYRDEDWVEQVRREAGEAGIHMGLDCISEGVTVERVDSLLVDGGRLAVVRGPAGGGYDPAKLRSKVQYGSAWEGLGVEIVYYNNMKFPANPSARNLAVRFFEYLGSGAGAGGSSFKLQPNPLRHMPGGLDRIVPDGFSLLGPANVGDRTASRRSEDYMRPISGEKMVYSL